MPIAAMCSNCKQVVPTVDRGLCPRCAPARAAADQARRAAHPRTAIYRTPQWRKASRACMERHRWRCTDCGRHITELKRLGLRLMADHVIPILECSDPYDQANLQARCSSCGGSKDGARSNRPFFEGAGS